MYLADLECNISILNADIFFVSEVHRYSQGNIYFNSSIFNADFGRIVLAL
jgi:hypothetical protein